MGKRIIAAVAVVGFILALIITNPSQDRYADYIKQKVADSQQGNTLMALVERAMAGVAVNNLTEWHNYRLFSVFTTKDLNGEQFTTLGILDSFFPLRTGDVRKTALPMPSPFRQ